MRGFFDESAGKSSRGKGDTELTLGSGTLLTVFFGLVLLCGLCFGLGYAVGSHGSKGPVFQSQPPAAGPSPQSPANAQQGKPSAVAQPPVAPAQPMVTDQGVAGASGTAPGAGQIAGQATASGAPPAATATSTTAGAAGTGQQVLTPNDSGWRPVQSALPGGAETTQNAPPLAANQVRPAMPGQGTLMVQIAALSNQEDASVLIGALRKRGYAISAVRYPSDNLIHVCVGPFSNLMDANAMKQKLQGDGYNAQVVP